MTLTPREYLHQHFGPKDRKWIESLSDERCWGIVHAILYLAPVETHRSWSVDLESGKWEDLHQLPDVPGEYPDWR